MRGSVLRGWLAIGAVALMVAGIPGREAAASPARVPAVINAFIGTTGTQLHELTAFRPAGRFRACVAMAVMLDGIGPGGCQRPASASRELAQHATYCSRRQVVIGGLVPPVVAHLRAVIAGRSVALRLRPLPMAWRVHGSLWLFVLRTAGTPLVLDAFDAGGAVVGRDAIPATATRCPAPGVSAQGRLPGGLHWRDVYSISTGAGAMPNLCESSHFADRSSAGGVAECLPEAEIPSAPVMQKNRQTEDDPPGTLFTGLLHRHAARLRITLDDGSTVTARILRFPARVKTPFAAYVAAVPGHHRAVRFSVRRG